MIIASGFDNLEIVLELIKRNANINQKDSGDWTALAYGTVYI